MVNGPTLVLPGIRLFDLVECWSLMGWTLDGNQFITTGEWFLDLELFRDPDFDNEDVVEFCENQFKRHEDWSWTPLSSGPIGTKETKDYLRGLFAKAGKRIEVTAISYHPRTGDSYRICMIEGDEPTPIWFNDKFIEIFDRCELSLFATGGPLEPVVLRGVDANDLVCDYGVAMPVDLIEGGTDPAAQTQMARELFDVLNKYPQITIDPQHFNIIGYQPTPIQTKSADQ